MLELAILLFVLAGVVWIIGTRSSYLDAAVARPIAVVLLVGALAALWFGLLGTLSLAILLLVLAGVAWVIGARTGLLGASVARPIAIILFVAGVVALVLAVAEGDRRGPPDRVPPAAARGVVYTPMAAGHRTTLAGHRGSLRIRLAALPR